MTQSLMYVVLYMYFVFITMAPTGQEDEVTPPRWAMRLEEKMDRINDKLEKLVKVEESSQANTAAITFMREEQLRMNERIIDLETRSMSSNLVFSGIPVNERETNDTLKVEMMNIINHDLELEESNIVILRCHRFMAYKNQTPPDAIAVMANKQDIGTILRNSKKLATRTDKLYLNQQYPREVQARRRILYPILRSARERKMKASLVKDKLIIESRSYTVNNLHELPFDTTELNQKDGKNCIAFLGRLSGLSNFYRSPFTFKGVNYTHMEQLIQAHKAITVHNKVDEMAIMLITDPSDIKRRGDRIQMTTEQINKWNEINQQVVRDGLMAKFSQHPQLKLDLIATAPKKLAEASTDRYWGCGKRLRDPQVTQPSKWTGHNIMSKLLEGVRRDLIGE